MVERIEATPPVPVAMAILNPPALAFQWANEYAYQMFARFTDEEIAGHPITEFLPIQSSPEIERALNNTTDTGEPAHLKGEIVGPEGVMPIYTSIYRLPDGNLLIVSWHPTSEPVAEKDAPVGTIRMGDEVPERE